MSFLHDPTPWRVLLAALLGAACVGDVRARRIPNTLVAVVLVSGVVRAFAAPLWGAGAAGAPTPASALLGVAAGLAAWLPLYAFGVLGAGDVKLFAAACAWLGVHGVVPASVGAALAGGALGLAWFAAGALRRPYLALSHPLFGGPAPAPRDTRIPYALAVTAGVLAAAWGVAP